jgi:SAM-dependent methyltransferase
MQITPPSSWVARYASLVPDPGPVLDLAAGNGRHTRYFKDLGYTVLAVDRDVSGLADLATDARVIIMEADLEAGRWPFADSVFGGVVVTNYLHRPILRRIAAALKPGGVLIYETFAVGNERFGKPSNPNFLLKPDELLKLAKKTKLVVHGYESGEVQEPRPAVLQRIVAQRPA